MDVTPSNDADRRRTNAAASDPRAGTLLDLLDDCAVVRLDDRGLVVSWNRGAERIYGVDRSAAIGGSCGRLYPPSEVAEGRPEQDLQVAAAAGRLEREGLQQRADGREFRASIVVTALRDEAGRLVGFGRVVRDVTARRREEQNLRLMVERSMSGIIVVNARGEITSVNAQTEKMFGYERSELIGRPIEILVPDRFQAEHRRSRDRFLGAPLIRPMGAGRDLFGRRRDGTEFAVEIGLSPLESDEGPAVLSSIVDITERKQAEDRARIHLADLAHVARLSVVGRMFSELAHEINQPLAAAANYARACVAFTRAGQGASPHDLVEWMEKTAVQTTRALDIVKRMAAFVKKDGGIRMAVDVHRLIERVVSSSALVLQAAAAGGFPVTLVLALDDAPAPVHVDAVQIEQVLLNLMRNAVEAMQSPDCTRRVLRLATSRDDRFVRVSLSDTGPGIAPHDRPRLFAPYFTTKPDGMGLGLNISRSISEDHDGRLEVESSSQGCTFRFLLPLANAEFLT